MTKEVPFGTPEEWSDIEPVEQYEGGKAPICAIPYSEHYVTILSYFRAILKKEEVSYRAYHLTEKVIEVSGVNYMAWFWRRKCLDELDIKAEEEIEFIRNKCIQYQKNYQIWHHRRCVAEKFQFHEGERQSLEEVFLENPKNFHAWTYRQWLTERFELYEGEDEFVAECLEDDVHNNSVWAYKYFLLAKSQEFTPELVSNQIEQVFNKYLPKDWNNEAAWAFIRGFTAISQEEEDQSKNSSVRRFLITKFQHFKPLLDKFFENEENQENRFALELLADYSLAEGNLDRAKESYQKLVQVDFIREKFWKWKMQRLEQKP